MRKPSSQPITMSEITEQLSRAAVVEASLLAATPAAVWERVASMTGVNAELMPLVRMTFPRGAERIDTVAHTAGKPLFRSVLLLFGVLPIDVHQVALAKLDPGVGFLECSSSLLHRRWIHERRLEPEGENTKIRDRVSFESRVPFLGTLLAPIVRAIFRHRHERLRRHFGTKTSLRKP
jgi:ligand-binding SRPBCC domain-containing protein